VLFRSSGSLDADTIGIQIEPRNGDITDVEVRNNVVHNIGPGQVDDDTCYYNGHGIIAQSEGATISRLVIDGNEIFDLYVGNSEVLVVNGAVEEVPAAWLDQLADGGRLGVVVRDMELGGGVGRATVFIRAGGAVGSRAVFDCATPLLPGFARPKAFSFE